jgi:hypothetical protein
VRGNRFLVGTPAASLEREAMVAENAMPWYDRRR